MARNKTSKAWMHEHVTDLYVQQSQAAGLPLACCLQAEGDRRSADRLIRPGMTVVDLGAAPGGWSQVSCRTGRTKRSRHRGRYAGDGRRCARSSVHPGRFPARTRPCARWSRHSGGAVVDLVVSDMAPNMSGIGVSDQARSAHLAELALEFALKWLKPGGNLLVKTFQGAGFPGVARGHATTFPPGADAQAGGFARPQQRDLSAARTRPLSAAETP